jgi:hypothetical protein
MVFEQELKLYGFVLDYIRRSAADISDAQLTEQPAPTMNPPLWILGHLAVATDYALVNLGQRPQCPKDWHRAFGMGSRPLAEMTQRPTKAELLAAIERGHAAVTAAVPQATAEMLEKPHPVEPLRSSPIQSVRDLISHLLTTHPMFHVGQLSYWRRHAGFQPYF